MSYHLDDTIAAIATAAGGAARGIVRVSGADALRIADSCFIASNGLELCRLHGPKALSGELRVAFGERKHQAILAEVFVWPNQRSYTREAVVEFHTLGSPPILDAVLKTVCCAGARLAEPGEFTMRAFLAGRLDLTQAEAVLGVVDARGEGELKSALAQLAGGLGGPLEQVRQDLLQLLAEVEAGLDFVEEDIVFIGREELFERLASADAQLAQIEQQLTSRHAIFGMERIVLLGEPNAGKSSLFNALVNRFGPTSDRHQTVSTAIVSPTRGTTRDYLTAEIDLNGIRVTLVDTAGMEELSYEFSPESANDRTGIEVAAQAHSHSQSKQAVLRVWCVDASLADSECDDELMGLPGDVVVLTKSDVAHFGTRRKSHMNGNVAVVATSSRTGEGLEELAQWLRGRLCIEVGAVGQPMRTTAERCRESIRLGRESTAHAMELIGSRSGEELVAVEIRSALNEIGKVVGAVYTDDVLERIFKSFCIGK